MPGRGCSGSRRGCAPAAATRRPALAAGRASGARKVKPSGPRRCGRGARRAARAVTAGRRPVTVRPAARAARSITARAASGGARRDSRLVQPVRRPPRHRRSGVDLSDLCCAAGAAAGPCAATARPGPLPRDGPLPRLWTRAGPPRPAHLPTLPEDAGGCIQSAPGGASAGPGAAVCGRARAAPEEDRRGAVRRLRTRAGPGGSAAVRALPAPICGEVPGAQTEKASRPTHTA